MRRVLTALALAAVAAGLGFASLAGADGGETVEVDAIFDSAGFLVAGEEVRIAGAPVGTITDLQLTDDFKARVTMEIDSDFAPFRADADCTIQPQSLIGDRFIQCAPGTSAAPALEAEDGNPPTVPVENTHTPVDLDVVLSTFDEPARDRFAIILSTLGAGVAGRSEELEELIRRSNPALGETKLLLDEIVAERKRIGSLVDESDEILAQLAARKDRVGAFIESGAEATAATAAEQDNLRATIRNLPPLLREVEPSLDRVREIAREGEPVLADLQESAPALDRVLAELPAFAREGRPALAALGNASSRGVKAVKAARPQVPRLANLSSQARRAAPLLSDLLVSSRDAGVIENAQRFLYNAARTAGWFDSVSHLAGAYVFFSSACSLVSPIPVAGCDSHFASYDGPAAQKAPWLTADGGSGKPGRTSALGEMLEGGRDAIDLPDGAPEPPAESGGAGDGGEVPAPGAPAPGGSGTPPAPGSGGSTTTPAGPVGKAVSDLLDFLTAN